MMMPSEDQRYFDLIDQAVEYSIVLVGESHDPWTELAESELRKAHVPFTFFSWNGMREARVQGEWIRFPVLQLWKKGVLETELIGFSQDRYRRVAQTYAKL